MSAPAASQDAQHVVCACFDVTEAQIRDHLADPDHDLETLVAETSIGTRCTACLLDLDLVVDDAVSLRRTVGRRLGNGPAVGRGSLGPADQTNSGFFICDGDVTTVLRVANYGMLFDPAFTGVPYDYTIRLVSEAGKLIARRRGTLERNAAIQLDVAELAAEQVRHGWFLLSLYPREVGIVGTVRPQVALCGPSWIASYHPQLHAMATRDRTRYAVSVLKDDEAFRAAFSVINARESACTVTARLLRGEGAPVATASFSLPPRGARLAEVDVLFPEAPAGTYRLEVLSDRETRKHILVRHRDGSLSVDHFPN